MNNSNITHKIFLSLMIPFILSTITQPLLGAADIAVVGKLNNVNYISGVSIGTLIFNTIYWIFGFLRVSTTAFSAQSSHYSDKKRVSDIFFRPQLRLQGEESSCPASQPLQASRGSNLTWYRLLKSFRFPCPLPLRR